MQLRVFLAVIPMCVALTAAAHAQRMADGATLDRILPDIRAQHPGRLSDAQPWTDESGRTRYRIKWMTPEGRILYFDADARTGRYWSSESFRDPRDFGPRDTAPRDSGPRDTAPRNGSADRPPRGEDGDNRPPPEDRSQRHDHWNGDQGPFGGDNGPPRRGDGERRGGDDRGNSDWRGNGDWHGGRGGDYGGSRHHGHGGN
jgi:hypothetical protein